MSNAKYELLDTDTKVIAPGRTVKRIVQNGRSTFFCPVCQK